MSRDEQQHNKTKKKAKKKQKQIHTHKVIEEPTKKKGERKEEEAFFFSFSLSYHATLLLITVKICEVASNAGAYLSSRGEKRLQDNDFHMPCNYGDDDYLLSFFA